MLPKIDCIITEVWFERDKDKSPKVESPKSETQEQSEPRRKQWRLSDLLQETHFLPDEEEQKVHRVLVTAMLDANIAACMIEDESGGHYHCIPLDRLCLSESVAWNRLADMLADRLRSERHRIISQISRARAIAEDLQKAGK